MMKRLIKETPQRIGRHPQIIPSFREQKKPRRSFSPACSRMEKARPCKPRQPGVLFFSESSGGADRTEEGQKMKTIIHDLGEKQNEKLLAFADRVVCADGRYAP